jgi:predicted transcriptional regulator of viral defense system
MYQLAIARQQLGKIIREAGEVFTVAAAARCLGIRSDDMAKTLARWAKQGWLTRIRRGLYAVVPMDASAEDRSVEDAWVLVPELYEPCYIGGWSAAEYWDLTEQIFHDICVLTEGVPAGKRQVMQNITFILTKINPRFVFGTKVIWKQSRKIRISDPHKTIIDMLYDLRLGGGIQHVVDCFEAYVGSDHQDLSRLGEYAERMENGAIFKRLGFLSERILGESHKLTLLCKKNLSQGKAYLDPALKTGPLITRWRLFVPESYRDLR